MSRFNKEVYSEVYSIINMLAYEDRNKIPKRLLNLIEKKKDSNYNVNIENLSPDAQKILSVLYTDYISTEEERKVIKAKEQSLSRKRAIKKDNIELSEVSNVVVENNKLQKYKKNTFRNFLEKIKRLFKK